ncbi:MAG TPA: hypothetical protein VFK05_20985 [Polyangiaceae bacterium]|nr:hypothetical protein [Polyangiaceae bacterium]
MTTVNVLVLTDGDGSFQAKGNRFALTEFVKTLTADAGDLWNFSVTTAHRYAPGVYPPNPSDSSLDYSNDADIKDFSFTNAAHFPPGHYDEVFLFGFATSTPGQAYGYPPGHALTEPELAVLASFMEAGGGVFAVGDHEDLGIDLCGKVPRVRSMRRWAFDYAAIKKNGKFDYSLYDETSSNAPPAMGVHRHSTTVMGANGRFEFDNQSDDIPQKNDPVVYSVSSGSTFFTRVVRYPHPLLCGMGGVIDVLPDHMHEGECVELDAAQLSKTYSFAGAPAKAEYPKLNGSPLAPQVVAWGKVVARSANSSYTDPGAPTYDDNEPLDGDTFGQISAWDGHAVGQGRVTVDSTFHHFVNVNVIGDTDDATHTWTNDEPIKAKGFLGSAAGQATYARIREYWRNIARWLAPQSKQDSHALEWLAKVASDPQLGEQIGYVGDLAGTEAFGGSAGSLLRRGLPPCGVLSLVSRGVPDPLSVLLGKWYILHTLPDPPPLWKELLQAGIDVRQLTNVALGAAVAETRDQLRSGIRAGTSQHHAAVQRATSRRVHELLQRDQAALTHAARALGRLAEHASKL